MTSTSITIRVVRLYDSSIAVLNRLQSPLLLLIRLYWGYQFTQSGWGKLHRISGVAEFFTSLGLPQPYLTAVFVALLEFVGGILFALGTGSRIISFMLFINMTVAYWTADREAFGHILNDPGKFYIADPYTFWFAALLILIFGPGYLALDSFLSSRFRAKH
jgi:putative oxidoreductase